MVSWYSVGFPVYPFLAFLLFGLVNLEEGIILWFLGCVLCVGVRLFFLLRLVPVLLLCKQALDVFCGALLFIGLRTHRFINCIFFPPWLLLTFLNAVQSVHNS